MAQSNDRYQLILNNQLAKGYTLEQVLDNLSVLFKKDQKVIREILSRPDFIVKNNVTLEQAKNLQKKLTKAGIGNRLHKIQQADASSAHLHKGAQISCPKCGTQQIASAECQNCGIIFAKYGQSSAVYEPKKTTHAILETSPSGEPWYARGSHLFVILIVMIAAVLLISTIEYDKKIIDPAKVGTKYYDIEEVRFLDELAEPGYETIVELYADWCKPCADYANYEKNQIMNINPGMAIRRIDVSRKNGFKIARERFNIPLRVVPYIIVFDEDGKVIADDGEGNKAGSEYVWYYGTR